MGAAAASLGVDAVMTSLLGATLVGAVMSVGVTWWRRRHPSGWGAAIAYGPAADPYFDRRQLDDLDRCLDVAEGMP